MFWLISSDEHICNKHCHLYSTPCTIVHNKYVTEKGCCESEYSKRQDGNVGMCNNFNCKNIKDSF